MSSSSARTHTFEGQTETFTATSRSGRRLSSHLLADSFQAIDFILIVAAAMISKIAYLDLAYGYQADLTPYFLAACACAVVSSSIFRNSRVSHSPEITARPFRPVRLLLALAAAFMLLLTIAYVVKVSELFSRVWLISWFGLSFIFLVVARACHQRLKRWLVRNGHIVRNIAVIGSAQAARSLAEKMDGVAGIHITTVGCPTSGPVSLHQLCPAGEPQQVDEVIIVTSGMSGDDVRNILADISGLPVQVRLCVDALSYELPFHGISRIGRTQFVNVRRNPMSHWGHLVKSASDYLLGGIMLLLLLPVFAAIAIAIKLDSRGPVFFRQRRHGLNHKVISVFKFRTMTVLEDGDVVRQATRNDSRVTWVGNILRRTSLDELPQLINVLRGEMSLVGPRPHALAHNAEYGELLKSANYASRHLVKPGITGWAQINGFRGPTDTPEMMRERVRCDLEYIDNWSIWFDMEILLLTLVYGFMGKNAV